MKYFSCAYVGIVVTTTFWVGCAFASVTPLERSAKPNAFVHLYPEGIPRVPATKQIELESIKGLGQAIENAVRDRDESVIWSKTEAYFSDAPDRYLAAANYLAFMGRNHRQKDPAGSVLLGEIVRDRLEAKLLETIDDGMEGKSRYFATLGRVYEQLLDQSSDAEVLYKKAVELDPNSSVTKHYLQKAEKRRQRLSRAEPMASPRVNAVLNGGIK